MHAKSVKTQPFYCRYFDRLMENKAFPDPSPIAFSFHSNLPNYILESRTLAITKQPVYSLRERT